MKKLVCILLTLALLLALAACGNAAETTKTEEPAKTDDAQKTEEPAQEAESPAFVFEKDITLVVPTNPGSTLDNYAQKFAELARTVTGRNINVEYMNGGATGVAMNYLMAQKNDGYTIMITGITTECSIASGQMENFDESKYYCVGVLNSEQLVVATNTDSAFNNMEDVLTYARENPMQLSWGAPSTYGPHHFFALNLMKIADVQINYVPYGNANEAVLAGLGKNVDIITGTESAILPYVESGELKILAQGMETRQDNLPNVPTVYETAGLEFEKFGINFLTNRTMMLRADCPEEVKAAWADLITQVCVLPEWNEFCDNLGANSEVFCVGDAANKFSHDYVAVYRELFELSLAA